MESRTNVFDLMIALVQQLNISNSDEADEVVKTFEKLIKAINNR